MFNRKSINRAPAFVFCSALMFSFGGLFMKLVPWRGITINGMRNLIAIFVSLIFFIISGYKIKFNKSVLIGALLITGTTTLFTLGNKMTTAANAIVLQFTAPIFVIFYSLLFIKRKPKKSDIIACFCVFFGVTCFFLDSLGSGGIAGNILSLLSGVCYGGVFMINMFPESDSLSSVFFSQIISALFEAPFIFTETDFSATAIGGIAYLGILNMGLAYVFLAIGLKKTKPFTASLLSFVEPIMSPIWVALFYKEKITMFSVIGMIIVFSTIITYNFSGIKAAIKENNNAKDKQPGSK